MKKKRVNYCFKSSCEINETLRALCWLKRSVATFNRLFNHTPLELCVCLCCPLLSTVDMFVPCQQHRHSQRHFLQIKTGHPLNVTIAHAHQTALIKHRALSFPKCIVDCCYCHFLLFCTVFQRGLFCPSPLCMFCVPRENGISHSLSVFLFADPTIFIFSIIFIFPPTNLRVC